MAVKGSLQKVLPHKQLPKTVCWTYPPTRFSLFRGSHLKLIQISTQGITKSIQQNKTNLQCCNNLSLLLASKKSYHTSYIKSYLITFTSLYIWAGKPPCVQKRTLQRTKQDGCLTLSNIIQKILCLLKIYKQFCQHFGLDTLSTFIPICGNYLFVPPTLD